MYEFFENNVYSVHIPAAIDYNTFNYGDFSSSE
jgi:hypothetical protein